jgi:hypothetical protein
MRSSVWAVRCGIGFAVLVLVSQLAACTGAKSFASSATTSASRSTAAGGTSAPGTPAQTTSPGSGTSGPEPTLGPSFPADTAPDGGPGQSGSGSGSTGSVNVSLRMDTHPGYGRLVVALNTPGVPAWTVAYSDKTGAGGGPVDIAGDAFLRVVLKTGAEAGNQGSSSVTASGVIAGVRTLGTFEGSQEVLIGVSGGQLPFRAFALTDPGRIVIDVRTP